jgi:hypothetical protein
MLCNGINQIFFMCYKNPNYWHLYNIIISYIIYSYKYLESDLIKHCHVICTHSLGQPLIVRSHSKVHRSGGNPKEIPTWAHVFPIIVTSLDSTDNKQVRRCRRRRHFIYYIEYFSQSHRYSIIWCLMQNIYRGWPNFSRGDKPSGHTPTRVIIV